MILDPRVSDLLIARMQQAAAIKTRCFIYQLVLITMATSSICLATPPGTAGETLEEYMQMDINTQNDLIFDTQEDVFAEMKSTDPERAICVAYVFSRENDGVERLKVIRGTLADAADKKLDKTARKLTELVLLHFCPVNSVD